MATLENGNSSSESMAKAEKSTEALPATTEATVADPEPARKPRAIRPLWLWIGAVLAVIAVVLIIVGALVARHVIHGSSKSSSSSSGQSKTDGPAGTSEPKTCPSSDSIPASAKGTWIDPSSWLDATDFNCTYTNETFGDLPIIGLNSTWDDSAQANSNTPPINKPWGSYSGRPFRGINLGGWLSLEPFITPSLFDSNSSLVDEYTLCTQLGPEKAAATLEKHYSTFITEQDFKDIAAAGLDHVRIPFSYWAVTVYPDDPYVFGVSWRYLLRGIEWARKHGLRVNLDLHGVPGSQNGWNHSGRMGNIGWIMGPNGTENAQRTLDIHQRLSKFFAQDRYKNIVVFYGLVNEPNPAIPQDELVSWTQQAYKIVRDNGVNATQIFSDAMRGLAVWTGTLTGYGDSLAIDVHDYTIFDDGLIKLPHEKRVEFACDTWSAQLNVSVNVATGFGPTMVGEFSQADTDCTEYLNGVGLGARWTGNLSLTALTQPMCPTQDSQCSCNMANADPSQFTPEYKTFLQTWAEAQMAAFEFSWGWFYWTWKTESAPLWSYQAGMQAKILPAVAYQRDWDCSKPIPSFGSLPEYY